jgi:basic amino acid/polyamine antiporter, APA family
VDAGGLRIVIAYGGAVLHRPAPQGTRDGAPVFRVHYGKVVGYAALVLSVGVALLYLPGGPSALVWPYE